MLKNIQRRPRIGASLDMGSIGRLPSRDADFSRMAQFRSPIGPSQRRLAAFLMFRKGRIGDIATSNRFRRQGGPARKNRVRRAFVIVGLNTDRMPENVTRPGDRKTAANPLISAADISIKSAGALIGLSRSACKVPNRYYMGISLSKLNRIIPLRASRGNGNIAGESLPPRRINFANLMNSSFANFDMRARWNIRNSRFFLTRPKSVDSAESSAKKNRTALLRSGIIRGS